MSNTAPDITWSRMLAHIKKLRGYRAVNASMYTAYPLKLLELLIDIRLGKCWCKLLSTLIIRGGYMRYYRFAFVAQSALRTVA